MCADFREEENMRLDGPAVGKDSDFRYLYNFSSFLCYLHLIFKLLAFTFHPTFGQFQSLSNTQGKQRKESRCRALLKT